MNRIVSLFVVSAAAAAAGCGEPVAPRLHPLTLVFPPKACKYQGPPCVDYTSCYDLGIDSIDFEVGSSNPEPTKMICLVGGPTSLVSVYYQPGQGSYVVNATYTKNGSTVNINAGPFGEDESLTPWKLLLQ